MKYLKPMILLESYYAGIERDIIRLFREYIFGLLQADIGNIEIINAINPLVDAIRHGEVWYNNGEFAGDFNAAITKELKKIGAVYNHHKKTWATTKLPPDVSFAVAYAEDHIDQVRKKLMRTLDEINPDVIEIETEPYVSVLGAMDNHFKKTINGVDEISISPQLTDGMKQLIAKEWRDNLNKYIQGWARDEISKMRDQITGHVFAGGRANGLARIIQASYGSSKAKAKFLARQETALLMSKFQESRYKDIGVTRYRWSGANDKRERPDHKALNGKVFSFDSPPVTDRKTGARNNPGEDYNCRCIATPILD